MTRALLQQAIDCLNASMSMMDECSYRATMEGREGYDTLRAITAIREYLAQPEPVAMCVDDKEGGVYYRTLSNNAPIDPLYLHPKGEK